MASNLFIIEAPGKRRGLFNVLTQLGIKNVDVIATGGSIASNPPMLKPLGIGAGFTETHYVLRQDRAAIARLIAEKSAGARRIFLAMDDDQEGDVIARDVMALCIPAVCHSNIRRVRLKALSMEEVERAMRAAHAFQPDSASKGDARRVIDRLIGALSSPRAVVGRVQGSLLLALRDTPLVIGEVVHTLAAQDGGVYVAREPIVAGRAVPRVVCESSPVSDGHRTAGTVSPGPFSYEDVLLRGSLLTGASVTEVANSIQSLYESGRLSYPRSRDRSLSAESIRRLRMTAATAQAGFDPRLFPAARPFDGAHAHEAPNALGPVPVNQPMSRLAAEDRLLAMITRNLLEAGMPAVIERPNLPSGIRHEVASKDWTRVLPQAHCLWEGDCSVAGARMWHPDQSLLRFMSESGLGRPSSIVAHVNKFLTRGLLTQTLELNEKGVKWSREIGHLFNNINVANFVEKHIECNSSTSGEMVAAMVNLLGLSDAVSALTYSDEVEYDNECYDEIYPGLVC